MAEALPVLTVSAIQNSIILPVRRIPTVLNPKILEVRQYIHSTNRTESRNTASTRGMNNFEPENIVSACSTSNTSPRKNIMRMKEA